MAHPWKTEVYKNLSFFLTHFDATWCNKNIYDNATISSAAPDSWCILLIEFKV
jgi:hypothetical protein